MKLNNLRPAKGSIKKKKRIGRGEGSGKGGTSTKGHKGAQSRSGYSKKIGFEGGQMPLYRRVPKFGFNNINRKEYSVINLKTLQILAQRDNISEFNIDVFVNNNLVKKGSLVKILGDGELNVQLKVEANAFSKSAKEAIEKLGGEAINA